MSIDQGTTSSRAIIFNEKSEIAAVSQREFEQIFPKPGWVEHNPVEILDTQLFVCEEAIAKAGLSPEDISAIGITNQRETTVLWEKETGKPVHNAIVWQCRRSADICSRLKEAGLEDKVREKTGLVLDPYFSGTKVIWLLENIPGLRERAEKGEILFGTIDSWLIYNLTGGNHYTEPSNACRTMLYNIHEGCWDKELLEVFKISETMLPHVLPSNGNFGSTTHALVGGEIPITGVIGDQQAALFGQACFSTGDVKNTYGTGCFTLMNTGDTPITSNNNLLTSIGWQLAGEKTTYVLEGSVFSAGAAVQWLRDQLGIIKTAADTEALALSLDDNEGVFCVPAFTGLGAPWWDPDARGTLLGLTRGSGKAHIVRAVLESIAYQSFELISAMSKDAGKPVGILKVDGGASNNTFLIQFQADILDIRVQKPVIFETTALGAAYMAGLEKGIWKDMADIQSHWKLEREFSPQMDDARRSKNITGWRKAVDAARSF